MCHAKIFQDLVQFKIIFLASMSKKLKRKQPTLAAFGFTKKVVHRGEEVAITVKSCLKVSKVCLSIRKSCMVPVIIILSQYHNRRNLMITNF